MESEFPPILDAFWDFKKCAEYGFIASLRKNKGVVKNMGLSYLEIPKTTSKVCVCVCICVSVYMYVTGGGKEAERVKDILLT